MKIKELKFKTTLSCGGCVSKVQADLDAKAGAGNWNVDIANSNKILTVNAEGITEDEVIAIVKSKGFKAESVNV